MKKVVVCIGSSCHLKGSRQVVEQLQQLIRYNNLQETVELSGTFCMGNCIVLEDTNGNRKLYKRRREEKIDNVAAMMDAPFCIFAGISKIYETA